MKAKTTIAITAALLIVIVSLATTSNAYGCSHKLIHGAPDMSIYPCYCNACTYVVRHNGTGFNIEYTSAGKLFGTNPNAIVLNAIELHPERKSLTINVTVARHDGTADSHMSLYSEISD